ncbi:unnamed protein product [Protopolystoma xenopodis]|uniref:SBNO alpha/beta domain-containing protein n=1 Tax=Protopolystoma xenopodis TaxID=117903 RepID=A0A3S5FDE8_9PLAT|nr:unnamed protein product [Protopolystoma xenopodis]
MELYAKHEGAYDGFYLPVPQSNTRLLIPILAIYFRSRSAKPGGKSEPETRLYRIYRPNTGLQARLIELDRLRERYTRVANPSDEACQGAWKRVFQESATKCIHLLQQQFCPKTATAHAQVQARLLQTPSGPEATLPGGDTPTHVGVCEAGLRTRTHYVLSGSVLNVWPRIEPLLMQARLSAAGPAGQAARCMQVVRLKPRDGRRIVGSLIPHESVDDILACLSQPAEEVAVTSKSGPFRNCQQIYTQVFQ